MRIQISNGLHRLSVLWLTISQWPWLKISEWCVLGFLALAVLWRGGKSLDATWMLVGVSWLCTVMWWWKTESDKKKVVSDKSFLLLWCCVILSVAWAVVSYGYSTTQNYGLDEVLRTGAFGLLFLWSVRTFTPKSDDTDHCSPITVHLFRLVTVVTFLACIIGLFIYILQPVNRFVGTFFDYRFHTDYWPNAWAEYVLLVWPIVFLHISSLRWLETPSLACVTSFVVRQAHHETSEAGLLAMTQRIWQDNKRIFICLSIFGFLIGCLFLSYSRGAMIAFAGQLVLWLVLFYPCILSSRFWKKNPSSDGEKKSAIPWKTIAMKVGIVLGTALVIFFVANIIRGSRFNVEDPWDKVTFDSAEGSSSVSERAMFWRQAASLAWQRPLFGWGPYSFRFVQPHVQEGILMTSDHPHNVFLKLAMEQGWIAVVLFGIIVGFVLWKGFRGVVSHKKEVESNGQREAAILLLVSLSGVLAHNLIDYNLQFVGISLLFWLVLALLYSHTLGTSEKRHGEPVESMTFLQTSPIRQAQGDVCKHFLEIPTLPTDHCSLFTIRSIRSIEVTVATILLLIALFEGRFLLISSLGRHAEARSEFEHALRWYTAAQGEWFSRDLHISRIQLLLNKNALPEASIAIGDYLKVNEADHRIWKIKGDFHLRRKEFNEALAAYERSYLYGKYNDLGPMLGIIDVYLEKQEWFSLKNRLPEFEKILGEYVDAIEKNTHFIALSDTVENFLAIVDRLEKAFPEDGPQYQVMGARVDRHAAVERERFRARPLGRLW